MKNMKSLWAGIFLVIIFLMAETSYAANYYVSTEGNDSNTGTSVVTPFATIQHAIDTATVGDNVFVAAGTYNENIFMKSGINVIGNSPADTIIVGQVDPINLAAVRFDNVACAVLKGFTITQSPLSSTRSVEFTGSTDYSAVLQNCIIYGVQYGIYVWWPATPSIVNNVLDGKGAGEQGIYIGNEAISPQIINNIITGWFLFGIHVIDESIPYSNDPNLEYNDVWGNGENYVFTSGSPLTDTAFTPVPDYINYRNRGNISDDPLFVDSANNDYHLLNNTVPPIAVSPCIDTGFPNGEFQNPAILTPGDGGFDMGAYGGGGNSFVSISKPGSGSGAVTSVGGTYLPFYPLTETPNYQLACPSSCTGYEPAPSICAPCSSYYTAGSEIILTAAADPGSYFGGWAGCVPPGSVSKTTQTFYLYYAPVIATFNPCTFTLSGNDSFNSSGGTGLIDVNSPDDSCSWTAASNDLWITIFSGSSGTGNGTVSYVVAGNTGAARTGTIEISGQTFTVNQDPCTYEINPYKAALPASGGQYTVSVFASSSSCLWTAASNDTWLTIDSGSAGTGNGTVTYSAAANTGAARTGTITIAGQTFMVGQIDNSLQETIATSSAPTRPGEPLWITATFVNNTGQTLTTAKPTCCDTYFWMTDASGNMVPPMDRICDPVGIPDSLISIPTGASFSITCDLSEMYSPENLTAGPKNVMATYVNPLPWDPHYDGNGGCISNDIDRIECYDLKPVVVPSAVTTITIGGDPVQKKLAVLGFNPLAWDPQWASLNGPAISAQISIFGDQGFSNMNDINLSSILMNGKVPIIADSAVLQNGVLTVKFDRSQAVQSLGSIVPGTTAPVTIQGSFAVGQDIFYGQGSVDIVQDTGTLVVQADMHTVGQGTKPSSTKAPLSGIEISVFDKKDSCLAGFSMSWQNYPSIWAQCTAVATITTNAYGQAIFSLPAGDYVVIGEYTSNGTTIYLGGNAATINTGSSLNIYRQIIQTAAGQILPAKYQKFTGSELLVIEPEYVEWSGTQELYPFIFESLGDWSVTTAVIPPEGFVADQESLSTDVNSNITALQFTVTDIGSKWVSTKVKHKIKH